MDLKQLFFFWYVLPLIAACGGGSSTDTANNNTPSQTPVSTNTFDPLFWDTPTPDYSDNPDRPVISLVGEPTVVLSMGDDYVDAGATAVDAQDGDISSELKVDNPVITSRAGDYLVRYSIADSDGVEAIEAVRIVRVYEQTPIMQTKRILGSTGSHFGYYEHLPDNYEDNPSEGFPLLIFHHGGGANANLVGAFGGNPDQVLAPVVRDGGVPAIIQGGSWDNNRPFIALSPQRSNSNGVNVARIDAFLEYAKSVYNVDTSRVYMTGWSQGGFASLAYAVSFPQKVAAIAPIAGGFFRGVPSDICNIAAVATWAFHGESDTVISYDGPLGSVAAVSAIAGCIPDDAARLTTFPGLGHGTHQGVHSLDLLGQGSGVYDLYSQDIYDWFLSHTID